LRSLQGRSWECKGERDGYKTGDLTAPQIIVFPLLERT
jgi:hypothetical protein